MNSKLKKRQNLTCRDHTGAMRFRNFVNRTYNNVRRYLFVPYKVRCLPTFHIVEILQLKSFYLNGGFTVTN